MLTQIKNTPKDIFGIEMSGKVLKKELKKIDAEMAQFKKKHGKFKFLAVVDDYRYASVTALWEDLKTGLDHFRSIEKAALASDVEWVEDAVKALNAVTPNLTVKTFDNNERGRAVEWLQSSGEDPENASSPIADLVATTTRHRIPEVVVITGASGGVGRATAIEFAKKGAKILLIARGREGLEGAKRNVENHGGQAWIYEADVSEDGQMDAAADFAERELGPIDLWVNNAMVSVFSRVIDMEPKEYRRVTEVTYLGQVYGTLAALKKMKPRNRGQIILVGSALAYRGIPLQSAYCGSKHAIQGFFESLRAELLHDNIDIDLSIIHLPAMNTTQFGWVKNRFKRKPKPMGTIYEPEVAARAIVELSENPVRLRMVGLPTLQTVWGNKLAPAYLDGYMAEHGFKGQLTDEPVDPDRRDNLWEPVHEDRGIHGGFANESKTYSLYDLAEEHKKPLALIGVGFLAAIFLNKTIFK